jgi:hypothetical protein
METFLCSQMRIVQNHLLNFRGKVFFFPLEILESLCHFRKIMITHHRSYTPTSHFDVTKLDLRSFE